MKKIIALGISFILLLPLVGCKTTNTKNGTTTTPSTDTNTKTNE